MGKLIMLNRGNYDNSNVVENVIRYVTRTRINEMRQGDLIDVGGAGVAIYLTPGHMIQQFLYVQKEYKIDAKRGRRIYHEVFSISDDEIRSLGYDMEMVRKIAMECCQVYFQAGHQVVFAIHWEPDKKLHIHFVVNTINYCNGQKWHTNIPELEYRENVFNGILRRHIMDRGNYIVPVFFTGLNGQIWVK